MTQAKWPTHYLAVESLSGKPRALFLTAYDSFERGKRIRSQPKRIPRCQLPLTGPGRQMVNFLSETDGAAFAFREEYSLRPEVDIRPHALFRNLALPG